MKDVKVGSIVEKLGTAEISIVTEITTSLEYIGVEGSTTYHRANKFKLIKTLPASEAKPGDTIISLTDHGNTTRQAGTIHELLEVTHQRKPRYRGLDGYPAATRNIDQFLVLQTKPTKKETQMNPKTTDALATILATLGGCQPETLQNRPKVHVSVYNKSSLYDSTTGFPDRESAQAAVTTFLSSSEGIGCTCIIHKEIKGEIYTTEIPIVKVVEV